MNNPIRPKLILKGTGNVRPNPMGRFVVGTVAQSGVDVSSLKGRVWRAWLKRHTLLYLQNGMFDNPRLRERYITEVLEEFDMPQATRNRDNLRLRLSTVQNYYETRAVVEVRGKEDPEQLLLPFEKQ